MDTLCEAKKYIGTDLRQLLIEEYCIEQLCNCLLFMVTRYDQGYCFNDN